ncbi:hypothetical protein [Phycisphaera mikurensis]|uniref:TPM domain-containing protein n=1 Tax=Phycisphaera mikurensis (strain NBRC 102666 / KCTC 22515 / FYK2301M01) TaxID=1142394 RepID=I0IH34_PHYMF|nr:hypothetical protein [Phycisphaera mikurensis]MBB6440827.1 hypothetical protein [Phycisphaera mikurensis]BAM04572.1 hypothetical protein PSMK_24130 [Phycisphaera mikurensis NBRC 102666]
MRRSPLLVVPALCSAFAAAALSPLPASARPAERAGPAERQAAVAERIPAVAEALAACEAGAWKSIAWETDPAAAAAEAQAQGRPLLVFVYKTVEGERPAAGELEGEGLTCLGARITRGAVFGDAEVRALIAERFVPLQVDVAAGGLGEALRGLAAVERLHERSRGGTDRGFSATLVLSPDGERVLATSLRRDAERGQRQARQDRPRAHDRAARPAGGGERRAEGRRGRLLERLEASTPAAYLQLLRDALEERPERRPRER